MDILDESFVTQDTRFWYPTYLQGEQYSFYLNFDTPTSDPDFDNFKLGLYATSDNILGDRVVDELATLNKDMVSAIQYNIWAEYIIPETVADGFYCLVIYDSTDDSIKCQSNFIGIGASVGSNDKTVRVVYRNDQNIYNTQYENLPDFYQRVRLPVYVINKQFESNREQYRNVSDRQIRNIRSDADELHTLQFQWLDDYAHRAICAMWEQTDVFINGNFYVPKGNYNFEYNTRFKVKLGNIDAYLEQANALIETPEPPAPVYGYLLEDVVSTNVVGAFSFRRLKSSYSGFCCRVRRSSDDTMLAIGFVDDYVDKDTILAFVGSGDGYLESWYNQENISYSLNMPVLSYQMKIVKAGVFNLNEAGFVAIDGDGTKNYMSTPNIPSLSGNAQMTFLSVHDKAGVEMIASVGDNRFNVNDSVFLVTYTQHGIVTGRDDSTLSAALVDKAGAVSCVGKRLADNSVSIFINNELTATNSDPSETELNLSGQLTIGSNFYDGGLAQATKYLSEIVIFAEDLSETNRLIAHANQMNYYNIG